MSAITPVDTPKAIAEIHAMKGAAGKIQNLLFKPIPLRSRAATGPTKRCAIRRAAVRSDERCTRFQPWWGQTAAYCSPPYCPGASDRRCCSAMARSC